MERGFLLDGYPRTVPQAGWLEKMLAAELRTALVMEIQVGYNELVRRITGRRICSQCGAIFNIHLQPPKDADVCDCCQAPLVQRADDREEVLQERLAVYEQRTRPVFEALRRSGRRIHAVDGLLPRPEVTSRIFGILTSE